MKLKIIDRDAAKRAFRESKLPLPREEDLFTAWRPSRYRVILMPRQLAEEVAAGSNSLDLQFFAQSFDTDIGTTPFYEVDYKLKVPSLAYPGYWEVTFYRV